MGFSLGIRALWPERLCLDAEFIQGRDVHRVMKVNTDVSKKIAPHGVSSGAFTIRMYGLLFGKAVDDGVEEVLELAGGEAQKGLPWVFIR